MVVTSLIEQMGASRENTCLETTDGNNTIHHLKPVILTSTFRHTDVKLMEFLLCNNSKAWFINIQERVITTATLKVKAVQPRLTFDLVYMLHLLGILL